MAPRTQYYTAATLDGYIADSEHSLDWLFQSGDSGADDYPAFIKDVGALAMGSSTYEWVLAHQENAEADHPVPWPYDQPAWVFSTRTLRLVDGTDVRFVRGDVAPVHAEMTAAAAGKNIWVVGGGDGLVNSTTVALGTKSLCQSPRSGAPLLPRAITTPPLELMSVQQFGESFAQLRYRVLNDK